MKPIELENRTRTFKSGQGYAPLDVRDVEIDGAPAVVSHWKPSSEELTALLSGAAVTLAVLGTVQPHVALGVTEEGSHHA